jgi:ribosomal protein S12 methylthiotransferase accessory factor
MSVVGSGRLASAVRDARSASAPPVAVMETVHDHGPVARAAADVDAVADADADADAAGPIVACAADDHLLLLVRSSGARNAPCPRCLLYHLATTPSQCRRLRRGASEPPASSVFATVADRGDALFGIEDDYTALLVDTEADRVVRTPVYKHPACSHAALPAWERRRSVPTPDTLDRRLIDPHLGIVRHVRRLDEPPGGDWTAETWLANFVNPAALRGHDDAVDAVELGVSCGPQRGSARRRAVMEAVERYVAATPVSPDVRGPRERIDRPVVEPDRFYLYEDSRYADPDFPFEPPSAVSVTEWQFCRELRDCGTAAVPTEFLSMTPPADETHRLVATNTSGTAAHFHWGDALVNAALELFERDAVVRHWFGGESRPTIDPATYPDAVADPIADLSARGYAVRTVDATRPGSPPVVELLAIRADGFPRVVATSGVDVTPRDALVDAVFEALGVVSLAADLPPGERTAVDDPSAVRSPADCVRFYHGTARSDLFDPLVDRTRRPVDAVGRDWRASTPDEPTDALAATATLYAAELTPPDLRADGVRVVRVLSPDLVPMSFGPGFERLAHPTDPLADDRPLDAPLPFL